MPLRDDQTLFEFLTLEGFQAGLSWLTILKKRENFRQALDGFDYHIMADYDEKKIKALLNDAGIIRNRLKINAAIHNAQRIVEIQVEFGSFKNWLDRQGQMEKDEWVKLFKKTFKFTGGEITNEFLMSSGYLPGAHQPDCSIYAEIIAKNPTWYVNSSPRHF